MRYTNYLLTTLLLLAIAGRGIGQTPSFITDSLDAYIQKGIVDWNIPGLAIVVVKDGKIVTMKGYGVRDLSTKAPVDANTLFMIASNTKLFTGTVLAQLENEKRLSLNDKISKYFPEFTLYDANASDLVTIRDMLSHRLGTKTFQGDFTFWNSTLSRAEIMNKMRLLKPVGLFRQDYGYCNSCFMAAGEVVSKVTGQSWEQYVQQTLLSPLQMTRSTAVGAGMENKENVARPYTTSYTGVLNRVPYDQWDNLGPAASIISSVNDLSHWLFFQLDSGRYHGNRLMPFSVLQRTRDINIVTSSRRSSQLPINFRGYGLGLVVADYNGRQAYWHTGGAAGMVSNVCFIPQENLGIAILTNNDNQSFFELLRYQILDAYLGMKYINRSRQSLPAFRKEMKTQLAEIARWKTSVKGNKPAVALPAYAGTYTNELYGQLTIVQQQNHLAFRFNTHKDLTGTLEYMDNDEWLMKYDNIEYGLFAIRFKIAGEKVISVETKANDFVEYDSYTFVKQP
ncbi:serine hydrolase [Chryseolinea lacunae]|uniref:Serine hydrolase n=1 Tax=Chryseolinea lacunae TaxID=2801331 RepID=A0ABS1KY72_9BACT|nr:serine hydrolase [Chryseolinea lacunae]MBL0744400.1 serine hydrolase [Chryseolinea lacunae]